MHICASAFAYLHAFICIFLCACLCAYLYILNVHVCALPQASDPNHLPDIPRTLSILVVSVHARMFVPAGVYLHILYIFFWGGGEMDMFVFMSGSCACVFMRKRVCKCVEMHPPPPHTHPTHPTHTPHTPHTRGALVLASP